MASDVSQQQPISAVPLDTCSSSANHRPLPTLPLLIYWDSFEARQIFQPVHSERNALDAINNQIKLLVEASESPKAYLGVVVCGTMEAEEIDEEMSDHQRWCINQKIIILTMALLQAKQNMEKVQNWDSCCEQAIHQATALGLRTAKCSRTVRNWYQEFRKERKIQVKLMLRKYIMISLKKSHV